MTLFCKYIRCFRLARDGKRACRKHQCVVDACREPVHLKCTTCFNHFPGVAQSFFSSGIIGGISMSQEEPQIVFSGGRITITESSPFSNNNMFGNSSFGDF